MNTSDKNGKQQEFITLRAKGNSYDKVAKKLHISRGTAVNWGHQFESEINDLQKIEREKLYESFKMHKDFINDFHDLFDIIKKDLIRNKKVLQDVSSFKVENYDKIEWTIEELEKTDLSAYQNASDILTGLFKEKEIAVVLNSESQNIKEDGSYANPLLKRAEQLGSLRDKQDIEETVQTFIVRINESIEEFRFYHTMVFAIASLVSAQIKTTIEDAFMLTNSLEFVNMALDKFILYHFYFKRFSKDSPEKHYYIQTENIKVKQEVEIFGNIIKDTAPGELEDSNPTEIIKLVIEEFEKERKGAEKSELPINEEINIL